jgi:hypothetical protein
VRLTVRAYYRTLMLASAYNMKAAVRLVQL